jgi:hypothetical protein
MRRDFRLDPCTQPKPRRNFLDTRTPGTSFDAYGVPEPARYSPANPNADIGRKPNHNPNRHSIRLRPKAALGRSRSVPRSFRQGVRDSSANVVCWCRFAPSDVF